VSGSVCNTGPHRTKLEPCAFKSVFLRYLRTQKGYKCYCSELNHFIISADVSFFELVPYFDIEPHSSESDEDFFCIF